MRMKPKQPGIGSRAFERRIIFIACIPHQIEAEWDNNFAPRLAGFPLNLLYAGVRWTITGKRLRCCRYWFNPWSYSEDGDKREMLYLPKVKSAYWVSVEYHKKDSSWHTLKYKDDKLVYLFSGRDFDRTMFQTTAIGLRRDEPVDRNAELNFGTAR